LLYIYKFSIVAFSAIFISRAILILIALFITKMVKIK
jgi:hypothetical protein